MNTIEPFSDKILESDMSPSVVLGLTLFLGAALGGYYFMDTVKRWNELDTRLNEIETSLHDTETMEVANSRTLHEMDQRIREKKDYDESEEIDEGKYQAWRGEYHEDNRKVEIQLWREKEMTVKSNQEWLSNTNHGPVTTRDFYLGNLNPEFHWEIREGDYYFITKVYESFVESWDTVIKLEIFMTFPSRKNLLELVETPEYNGDPTVNSALQKLLEKNLIRWQRVLIDLK